MRWLTILCCILLLNGCNTIKEYPLESAAIADTVSTELALSRGYTELNPLGPVGAILVKLALITVVYNLDSEREREFLTQAGTGLWTGAAVNNSLLYLGAGTVLAPVAGVITAVLIYTEWKKD